MERDNDRKNQVLLIIIGVATLLIAVVGATFAYFTATASQVGSQASVRIKTAQLGINYTHGSMFVLDNANGLDAIQSDKTWYVAFSVTSTGSVTQHFNVVWDNITKNTIVGKADLTTQVSCATGEGCVDVGSDFTYDLYEIATEAAYTGLTSENVATTVTAGTELTLDSTTNYLADLAIGTGTGNAGQTIKLNNEIAAGVTKYYVMVVHFEYIDTTDTTERSSKVQNYQQGKEFQGNIKVTVTESFE